MIGDTLKNKQKSKRVFTHEITRLIIMKMKMKMNNRSNGYDKNGLRSRRGHKYKKYKKCLIMMKVIYINEHLSII